LDQGCRQAAVRGEVPNALLSLASGEPPGERNDSYNTLSGPRGDRNV